MAARRTYRDIVREIALDNYGYVTTGAAADAGVPAAELPKLAARGGLDSISYGLYRVPDIPHTEKDQLAEALFRVGRGAYLYGETVLAMHGLVDAISRKVKVATARRVRSRLPLFVEVTRVRGNARTTTYEGLTAQPVAEAILACRDSFETEQLFETIKRARTEGLMSTTELRRVEEVLRARNTQNPSSAFDRRNSASAT